MNTFWHSTLLIILLLLQSTSSQGDGDLMDDGQMNDNADNPIPDLNEGADNVEESENDEDYDEDETSEAPPHNITDSINGINYNGTNGTEFGTTESPLKEKSVNLTDFFLRMYNNKRAEEIKKEGAQLDEPEGEHWRACYACFRLVKLGPNRGERRIEADTCGQSGVMPKTRCTAVKPSAEQNVTIKDGFAMPACAKSFVHSPKDATEITIWGCYSPYLLTNNTGKGRNRNTKSVRRERSVPVQHCQSGFGKGIGTNNDLSVYIWCCDDDLCNAGPSSNFLTLQHCISILFSLLLIMINST